MESVECLYALSDEDYNGLSDVCSELLLLLSAVCGYRSEDQHVTLDQSGLACFLSRLTTELRSVLERCQTRPPPVV